jgi:squalene-hopene/tetraprenyl-beta-curcumene cyclase
MKSKSLLWVLVTVASLAPSVFCADWNRQLAADYLDTREKEWFAWPGANHTVGGPCISCHTNMTYLLARPALRHALGEKQATQYEQGLLDTMRARLDKKDAADMFPTTKGRHGEEAVGVESVLATLFLVEQGAEKSGGKPYLSAEARKAFDRMWTLQLREGKSAGAWTWNEYGLDPWEMPDSVFYGAALAAVAVGEAPAAYRSEPDVRERVQAMVAYLQREQQSQPMHNRLLLLWASSELSGLLPEAARKSLIAEVQRKQDAGGGWTLESLGPWEKHINAPPSEGSNSYATGLTAFVLQRAGVKRSEPGMAKALDWLRSHQDVKTGSWAADSMNKGHADPMTERFMRDAATGFAVLALVEPEASRAR